MNYEASIKYAEQAIKSGFVLHGGALVLFSGYAAIFKLRPEGVVVQIPKRPAISTSGRDGVSTPACE